MSKTKAKKARAPRIRRVSTKLTWTTLPAGADPTTYTTQLNTPAAADEILHALIGSEVQEVIVVLHLSPSLHVMSYDEVGRGSDGNCNVTVADVLRSAVVSGCSRIIFAHNHPSGDCTPSNEDIVYTAHLRKACSTLGITLIDSVIVGDEGSYSFALAGAWNEGPADNQQQHAQA